MADALKVSPTVIKQPIVGRNQTDPQIPFQIKDVSKINNLNVSKQTLNQNQTLLNSDGPKILLDLLKDTQSGTQFLHSLYFLQEISQLVPLENISLSEEIESMFNAIFLKSDSVLSELLNQSSQSSLFKGELFDWIRDLLVNNKQLENTLIQLLKSMNLIKSKPQYKESLLNQTNYLIKEFKELKQEDLIKQFIEKIQNDSKDLSKELNEISISLEKTIMYRPQLRKHLGIMQYNLSRYLQELDIEEFLLPLKDVLKDDYAKFVKLVNQYIEIPLNPINTSDVIDKIIQLLEVEIKHSNLIEMTHDKIERIVISLLSSPSNFVPLLHFILPLQGDRLHAYSEVWVDSEPKSEIDDSIQVLIAIEIESMGHFEIELLSKNNRIRCELFCPEGLVESFKPLVSIFSKRIMESNFSVDTITIHPLIKARSLMEVFSHLSDTQSGLDIYA